MRQETERETKLAVVVKCGHEPIVVPAHVGDRDDALASHNDLVGVRKDPAKGDEVRELLGFNKPLPHGKGFFGVGVLPGPSPKG